MQMTFRWYGEGNDRIKLSDIKQIPGVKGIVWALHNKMPGEIWSEEEIAKVKEQCDEYGFNIDVVESVNVHDDIKIGLPTRDQYIENYKQTIRNLSKFGVKVICYNFMPIFDWTRSNLFHEVGDGSTALFYEKGMIQDDYNAMAKYILDFTEKYNMTFPGWEPERMAKLDELFKAYAPVTKEKLWENLKYFLEAIMPTCRECDIKMAIHMDDPPWDIFGLPRLLVDEPSVDRFLKMVDDEYNCLTLCSGSLNANPENNVADIVRKHCDRIAFAHIRNVKHFENGDFSEASHRDCDGDTGILTNERYKGDAIINKTFVVDCLTKKVRKNNGERPKYYVENNHPAIIDAVKFARVQEEIARRSPKRQEYRVGQGEVKMRYSAKYALTQVLVCGECKSPYRRYTWVKNGEKKRVWRCECRTNFKKQYCKHSPAIEEECLHETIMNGVMGLAQENTNMLAVLKKHVGQVVGESVEDNSLDIQVRINEIDKEFKALIDSVTADMVDGFDQNRVGELMREKQELQKKLQEIKESKERETVAQSRLLDIYTVMDGLKNHPLVYDDSIVRNLVECIVVESKESILIIFKNGMERRERLVSRNVG